MSGINFNNITTYLSNVSVSGNICTMTDNINLYIVLNHILKDSVKQQNFQSINIGTNQIFDGSGYAINIYQNQGETFTYSGLFSSGAGTTNKTIKNVTIKFITASGIITMTQFNSGFMNTISDSGFIIHSGFIINNCHFEGDISGNIDNPGPNGGIVSAQCNNIIVSNCTVSGNIYSYGSGGICSSNCEILKISNCIYYGNIYANDAGGICGDTCFNIDISNCSVYADIPYNGTGINSAIGSGGIVGAHFGVYGTYCNIANCFYNGNIVDYGSFSNKTKTEIWGKK